jgi:hypothetical protein
MSYPDSNIDMYEMEQIRNSETIRNNQGYTPSNNIDDFRSNVMSVEEKVYRMNRLNLNEDQIDKGFMPYLEKINEYDFIMTTQCCTGHGKDDDRKPHFDFRSGLSENKTINYIIRPLQEKFYVDVNLMTELDMLRYVIWMEDDEWEDVMKFFIELLENYKINHINNGGLYDGRVYKK